MAVSPIMTFNTSANALSSQSLAASGTVTFNIDASTKFEVHVQVKTTGGGTVAGTNGCQIDYFAAADSTPTYDTSSSGTVVLPTATSAARLITVKLPTGKYQVKLTNLDASNAITVLASTATIDSIG